MSDDPAVYLNPSGSPCSLDWLLICDNMSFMPSEHNNLMVHAASVALSQSKMGEKEDFEEGEGDAVDR